MCVRLCVRSEYIYIFFLDNNDFSLIAKCMFMVLCTDKKTKNKTPISPFKCWLLRASQGLDMA